jgi:hypothetical protein
MLQIGQFELGVSAVVLMGQLEIAKGTVTERLDACSGLAGRLMTWPASWPPQQREPRPRHSSGASTRLNESRRVLTCTPTSQRGRVGEGAIQRGLCSIYAHTLR